MTDLVTWTVYAGASDTPFPFVVRRWEGTTPGPGWGVFTLAEARLLIEARAPGSVRIERAPDDDAVIVETWI